MPITSPSLVLPNLVICGVPKAATSSLFGWIAAHPDALGTREKETYFFVDPGTHMYRADPRAVTQQVARFIEIAEPASAEKRARANKTTVFSDHSSSSGNRK